MPTKLYVGNLPFQATEEELLTHFSTAGQVDSVDLMRDRRSGRSCGYAFVAMNSADAADKAVDLFHRKDFLGRTMTLNLARPPENQKPRSRFHSV